jgi:5-hydroxyisourate hydrolase
MTIAVSVTDCTYGRGAQGLGIGLERRSNGVWGDLMQGCTDDKGQVSDWSPMLALTRGIYRIHLDIDTYFVTLGVVPVYPSVTITFRVRDPATRYNVAVLITPYANLVYQPSR